MSTGEQVQMDAAEYNRIRRILFCTVHDQAKGFPTAYEYLERYRSKIGPQSYVGLKAELAFYQKHGREFNLTVAGDMGEHADFSGTYGYEASRFDVTTNDSYKNFAEYEPYMGHGPRYKVALLDQDNFEIIDVYDLAFKKCPHCGGYLIPCIALLKQNYNRHGEAQWTNDQLLFDVCTGCHEWFERQRLTHHGLLSPQELFESVDESDLANQLTEQHTLDAYKHFRRQFDDHLMAVAQHSYKMTDIDGGGYWVLDLIFKNTAVALDLPQDIECSHDI